MAFAPFGLFVQQKVQKTKKTDFCNPRSVNFQHFPHFPNSIVLKMRKVQIIHIAMKNKTMQELDEQYKNAREHIATYEVGGVTYTVHSFCVGDKNINEVMERLAMQYALNGNEAVTA